MTTTGDIRERVEKIFNDWIHTQTVGPGLSKPPIEKIVALIESERLEGYRESARAEHAEYKKEQSTDKPVEDVCRDGVDCAICKPLEEKCTFKNGSTIEFSKSKPKNPLRGATPPPEQPEDIHYWCGYHNGKLDGKQEVIQDVEKYLKSI
jgi:hypothetical protein